MPPGREQGKAPQASRKSTWGQDGAAWPQEWALPVLAWPAGLGSHAVQPGGTSQPWENPDRKVLEEGTAGTAATKRGSATVPEDPEGLVLLLLGPGEKK